MGVLRLLHPLAPRHPQAFAHLLQALDFHLSPTREVALAGATPRRWRRWCAREFRPHIVLAGGEPDGVPLLEGRSRVDGRAAAYVCERFACQRPVTEPEELASLLALTAAAALAALSRGGRPGRPRRSPSAWRTPGPAPAASRAEARAHALVKRIFTRAGLQRGGPALPRAGQGPLAQRDRRLRHAGPLPADRDGAHRLHARARPGANDNASGVGVLAALAPPAAALEAVVRRLAGGHRRRGARLHRLARPPRRAGAARAGRAGTAAALGAVARRGRPRAGLLAAVVGARRAPRGRGRDAHRGPARQGARVRWVRDEGSGNSDHREFQLAGLPAAKLGVGARGEPCRHMPCDRAGRLQPRALGEPRLWSSAHSGSDRPAFTRTGTRDGGLAALRWRPCAILRAWPSSLMLLVAAAPVAAKTITGGKRAGPPARHLQGGHHPRRVGQRPHRRPRRQGQAVRPARP